MKEKKEMPKQVNKTVDKILGNFCFEIAAVIK